MILPYLSKILLFLMLLVSFAAQAQDTPSVQITLPSDFAQKICQTPVWKGKSATWKGVVDKRPDVAVGYQTKKNIETRVLAEPTLQYLFEKALTTLLPSCGLAWVTPTPGDFPGPMELSLEINEFQVESQKKFLTGKSQAKSHITLIGKHAGQTTLVVEVGYGIDSKKLRQKDLKQLQATLNDLLFNTLEQIPLSRQLQDGLI